MFGVRSAMPVVAFAAGLGLLLSTCSAETRFTVENTVPGGPRVTIVDRTGLLEEVGFGAATPPLLDPVVTNVDDDPRTLVVGWRGTPCRRQTTMTLARGPDDTIHVLLDEGPITLPPGVECDDVALLVAVTLRLKQPVEAESVVVSTPAPLAS